MITDIKTSEVNKTVQELTLSYTLTYLLDSVYFFVFFVQVNKYIVQVCLFDNW